MIEAEVFKLEHLDTFNPKTAFVDLKKDMERNLIDINKTMLSLFKEDRCIAIAGVNTLRHGVGEVWILPGKEVDENKYGFYKAIKRLIYDILFEKMGFHRLEIAIKKNWDKGYKWAQSLGFKYQGLVEAYDWNYTDHAIFYKVVKHG